MRDSCEVRIMVKKIALPHLLLLLWASEMMSQGESMCPPNTAMGLCTELATTCFSDSDCYNGEICCPEACSRTCKPPGLGRSSGDGLVPDLLNDPRVYVGKCPDASCYNLFGGGANECSTSKMCPHGKYCCHDGCQNVCLWKPEFAAVIAQQQARDRHHQHIIIQKQQEEMRRKQQEMYAQRQRQMAAVEQAKQQKEARAAAEAELLAQQKRATFEANLRAAAVNQAKMTSTLRQQEALVQILPQTQQLPVQLPAPLLVSAGVLNKSQVNSNSRSNTSDRSTALQQQTSPTETFRSVPPTKTDNTPESFSKHINSPASLNPHNFLSQQNVANKEAEVKPAPLQPAVVSLFPNSRTRLETLLANPTLGHPQSYRVANLQIANPVLHALPYNPSNSAYSSYLPGLNKRLLPVSSQPGISSSFINGNHPFATINAGLSNPAKRQSPAYIIHQPSSISSVRNQPAAVPRQGFQLPYRGLAHPGQTSGRVNQRTPSITLPYRSTGHQQSAVPLYRGRQRQNGMNPYLMYEVMQTAV